MAFEFWKSNFHTIEFIDWSMHYDVLIRQYKISQSLIIWDSPLTQRLTALVLTPWGGFTSAPWFGCRSQKITCGKLLTQTNRRPEAPNANFCHRVNLSRTFPSQIALGALPLACVLFPSCNLSLAVIYTKASQLDADYPTVIEIYWCMHVFVRGLCE